MKKINPAAFAVSALLLMTGAAQAQNALNAVRVGAKDQVALAKFYESAFGMQETNRIGAPGGAEIFLNFGDTVEAAKANKANPVVIMHRDSDDIKDPVPHIIFNIKDMNATVAAVKAAGGSTQGNPVPFGKSGMVIVIAQDPVGNRLELIQRGN